MIVKNEKKSFIVVLFFWIASMLAQQNQYDLIDAALIAKLYPHYQNEYVFDKLVDLLKWQQQKPCLHVSFASTDEDYFRTEAPAVTEEQTWNATGWQDSEHTGNMNEIPVLLWT